jgi:hypothetical protein
LLCRRPACGSTFAAIRPAEEEEMQRRILALLASVVVCVPAALAANGGHQQSVDIVTRMMEPLKDYWVSLRNDGDSDWIYFITLSRARCVLSEVRYSVNSDALDQVFTPYACDLRRPYTLPNTVLPKDIAVDYDDGALETVSVQATFTDGTKSEVLTYRPCDDAGLTTCAVRVE